MTGSRKNVWLYSAKVLLTPSLALMLLVLCSTSVVAAGKTIFLPLKVQSSGEQETLKNSADQALNTVLKGSAMVLTPRQEAESLVDYRGTWPPAAPLLKELAAKTGSENLVTGQLTAIGNTLSVDLKLFDLLAPENPRFFFKTADTLAELPKVLTTLAGEITAQLARDSLIVSIAPEGNKRIDSGAILSKIATKVGDPYSQNGLRNDLKEIFKMGFFNDVQIHITESAEGKKVVFQVVEKPVISSVVYEGTSELKEEDVKAAANIKENFILNPPKISSAEEAIKNLYKTKGFYNSTVVSTITYPDDRGAVVRFKINEGKKIFIKEITVEGNTTFNDDELLDEIETNEKWFMSWLTDAGLLDMNKIQQDAQKIAAFYNNAGFLEAKVGDPQISQKEEWLFVKFVVDEGPRFRVGTVDISGDIVGDMEKILSLLTIRNEKFVSRQLIRDNILALNDYYSEFGYAFANIKPVISKSPSGDRMDVNLKVSKGNLVYIDRITIKGNTRTRDNVIRRELRVAEGGVFDSKAIRQSTQALQRLSYFEEVTVTPEPSLDPDRMHVVISVKEKSTGTFSIGAGYSSSDQMILMGQIAENNFLGRGDTLSLSANVSANNSRYNLAYTNPHLNDSQLSWGFDLFDTEREYDDYTKDSMGGGVRIGYPVFEKWRILGNYSYTDTDLTDVSEDASYIIRNSVDLHITSAIKLSLIRDTRNKLYGASDGSRNSVSVKYAGGPLSGDAEFTKVEASSGWYFPLVWKTVFHANLSAGQVFENQTDKLPVYERFYLGGMNSVRGFEFAKISPIDEATGERIGGDKMWYTNAEFVFPLLETQGLMGVIFFDSGQVLNDDDDWGQSNEDIKMASGLEVRWLSPMGPLRLVWGYNLDPQEGEDDSVWDFSVGGVF